jgi:hypothetical protein
MQSLSPEVARADAEVRAVYQDGMIKVADQIAKGLPSGSPADRRARAWAFLSVLSGGATIARAMEDQNIAEQIAKSARLAALGSAAG